MNTLLRCDPEKHFDGLLTGVRSGLAAAADEATAMRLLRRMKAEAALLIAFCDIGGVWPVMRVTAAVTDVAVTATGPAREASLRTLLAAKLAQTYAVLDFNADGFPDIAVVDFASDLVALYAGDKSGRFHPAMTLSSPGGPRSILSADGTPNSTRDRQAAGSGAAERRLPPFHRSP